MANAKVFISYTESDLARAEEVRALVEKAGHAPWHFKDPVRGTAVGADWKATMFDQLYRADLVVCLLTDKYRQSIWCTAEIATARALNCDIFPILMESGGKHPLVDDRLYANWVIDRAATEKRLDERLQQVVAAGGGPWVKGESPYPGLRTFDASESNVFFGRSYEVAELTTKLRSPEQGASQKVLTIVGPSGCGKSSLLRAGLLPEVARSELPYLVVPTMLPGSDPVGNLSLQFADMIGDDEDLKAKLPTRAKLAANPNAWETFGVDLLRAKDKPDHTLLLVIDQLEQLVHQTPEDERRVFATALAQLLRGPTQIVATMRPEFLNGMLSDRSLELLPLDPFTIGPLTHSGLVDVIKEPARKADYRFEPVGLPETIADDTVAVGYALPLLAFTLHELTRHCGPGKSNVITGHDYSQFGGVKGALAQRADEALADASRRPLVGRKKALQSLLPLIDVDDRHEPTIKRVPRSELNDLELATAEKFYQRGLVEEHELDGVQLLSIAHESIVRHWPPLAAEVSTHTVFLHARGTLEAEAKDWDEHGRKWTWLLTGPALTKRMAQLDITEFHWLRKSLPPWFRYRRHIDISPNAAADDYLAKSIARDAARRAAVMVTSIVSVLALAGIAAWAFHERNRAETGREQQTVERLVAEGQAMLTDARPGTDAAALQQILTAYQLDREGQLDALFDPVVKLQNTVKIFQTPAPANTVAVSRDEKYVVASDTNGDVWRWDSSTGQVVGDGLHSDITRATTLRLLPGDRVLLAGADGRVQEGQLGTTEPMTDLDKPAGAAIVKSALSADGLWVAYGAADGRVWVGSARKPYEWKQLSQNAREGEVTALAFSDDGVKVVAAGKDTKVRVWAREGGALPEIFSPNENFPASWQETNGRLPELSSVAVSADGRIAAGGWSDNGPTLLVWDSDHSKVDALYLNRPGIWDVAFGPDGQLLAAGIDDRIVLSDRKFDTKTFLGHMADVRNVVFGPDNSFASAAEDNTVRLWKTAPTGIPSESGLSGYRRDAVDVTFAADAARFAAVNRDGSVQVWPALTTQPVTLPPSDTTYVAITFEPAGNLITVDQAGIVQRWTAASGYSSPSSMCTVTGAAYVDAGARSDVVVAGKRSVQRCNSNGAVGPLHSVSEGDVTAVAIDRDGSRVAYGTTAGKVRVLDSRADSTSSEAVVDDGDWGNYRSVAAIAFNPVGGSLATVSAGDDSVRIVELDGMKVTKLVRHGGDPTSVAYTPDGRYVVSGANDDNVQIWNPATGQPLGPALFRISDVRSVAVTADGRTIRSHNQDGFVMGWPGPAAWEEILCSKLTFNMNRPQWDKWVGADRKYTDACPNLPPAPT